MLQLSVVNRDVKMTLTSVPQLLVTWNTWSTCVNMAPLDESASCKDLKLFPSVLWAVWMVAEPLQKLMGSIWHVISEAAPSVTSLLDQPEVSFSGPDPTLKQAGESNSSEPQTTSWLRQQSPWGLVRSRIKKELLRTVAKTLWAPPGIPCKIQWAGSLQVDRGDQRCSGPVSLFFVKTNASFFLFLKAKT